MATGTRAARRSTRELGELARLAVVLGGLAASVGLRVLALHAAFPIGTDGLVFGAALLGLAAIGHQTATRSPATVIAQALPTALPSALGHRLTDLAIGAIGGLVLIGIPLGIRASGIGGAAMHPDPGTFFAFPTWAALTILVAVAEEVVLRGVVMDIGLASIGVLPTVAVSSLAFALLHVPFYGWGVVPLDIAVGIWLCGLRLVTGSVAAPTAAHALADLATWWL